MAAMMAGVFLPKFNIVECFGGLNLVLLGGIGAGKSASGNTILGRQAFISKEGFTSVTLEVAVESGTVYGRRVTVYDTPGLFNTKLRDEEIQEKLEEVLQRCESGPCVFLLVIKPDRFTGKERRTVEKIEELLGDKRLKKTWILFTGRDELEDENMTIKEFIDETEPLKRLVQKYEQRYHVFNNKKKEPNGQVKMLLTKIYATHPDTIVEEWNAISEAAPDEPDTRWIVVLGNTGAGKSGSGETMEEERRQREEKLKQEEIKRVIKETEERVRAEFEGPPRFLQERLKEMRLREEERRRQVEELERDFDHLMSRHRHLAMQRKEEEEQTLEEIERVIKETEERIRAVCEGLLRFLLERLESVRQSEEERRQRVEESLKKLERDIRYQSLHRHRALQREEEEEQRQEIERVIKETEERIRVVCEGPLRFLQERLEPMRQSEEERRRRVEESLKELERDFHHLMSRFRHIRKELYYMRMHFMEIMEMQIEMGMETHMKMLRKKEEQRQEIERVIKETEERVRAEFEGPLRFLQERLKEMRLREEERRRREEENQWPLLFFLPLMVDHRHMALQRNEEQRQEIERVIKETEERVRAVCDGPPRFLQKRLESMRQSEEERRRRVEESLKELERDFHHLMSRRRYREERAEMQRKQEEIERVIKETEERIRAEFKCPPR